MVNDIERVQVEQMEYSVTDCQEQVMNDWSAQQEQLDQVVEQRVIEFFKRNET